MRRSPGAHTWDVYFPLSDFSSLVYWAMETSEGFGRVWMFGFRKRTTPAQSSSSLYPPPSVNGYLLAKDFQFSGQIEKSLFFKEAVGWYDTRAILRFGKREFLLLNFSALLFWYLCEVLIIAWEMHGFYWVCLVGAGCTFCSARALTFPGCLEGCFKACLKYREEVSLTVQNCYLTQEISWKPTQLPGGKLLVMSSLPLLPGQARFSHRGTEHCQQKSVCVRLWFHREKGELEYTRHPAK